MKLASILLFFGIAQAYVPSMMYMPLDYDTFMNSQDKKGGPAISTQHVRPFFRTKRVIQFRTNGIFQQNRFVQSWSDQHQRHFIKNFNVYNDKSFNFDSIQRVRHLFTSIGNCAAWIVNVFDCQMRNSILAPFYISKPFLNQIKTLVFWWNRINPQMMISDYEE